MSNFNIKINLLGIKGAFVKSLQGRDSKQNCLIIPLDLTQGIFQGKKGIYLSLNASEIRDKSKFNGESHTIKILLSKEDYKALSEEEKKNLPFIGTMREVVFEKKESQSVPPPINDLADYQNGGEDDLPF